MCQALSDAGHDVTLFARPGDETHDDFAYYGVRRVFRISKTKAPGTQRLREWVYALTTSREVWRAKPSFDLVYGRHLPSLALAVPSKVPFIY
ncbi:MAG: glycosyltransferase, partial [Planctomycetaceae bacterium]|nr:glycosyltransferase [Planctomycetaceae bacterium]